MRTDCLNVTMEIPKENYEALLQLAKKLNFPPDAALDYAVYVTDALITEGLLPVPPQPRKTTTQKAKIIPFPKKQEF